MGDRISKLKDSLRLGFFSAQKDSKTEADVLDLTCRNVFDLDLKSVKLYFASIIAGVLAIFCFKNFHMIYNSKWFIPYGIFIVLCSVVALKKCMEKLIGKKKYIYFIPCLYIVGLIVSYFTLFFYYFKY